jgi:hypothetical protein
MSNHTQHPYMDERHERLSNRADAALSFLLALAIGVGFGLALVAWWTS